MAGFFDTVATEADTTITIGKTNEEVAETIPEADTASVSAFFSWSTESSEQETGTTDESPVIFIQEAPKETAHIEIETAAEQTETIGEMTSTISSSPNETITPAASDHETDANAIILEAIVKMTALHDRKACSRDTIMAEVEDINSQIAALKDKAKERTSQAKDIAADMKKIEENIAVLQTQKSA